MDTSAATFPGNAAEDRPIGPGGSRLIAHGPDLRWVDPPRMERVTLTDAYDAAETATKNPIFTDTFQTVFAACRLKPAPWPQQRTHPPLIAPNKPDCYPHRQEGHLPPDALLPRNGHHDSSNFRASFLVSPRSLACSCFRLGGCFWRGITIQSKPLGMDRCCER